MNHTCNRSLNVFELTLPLYYNNAVCHKQEEALSSYMFGIVFSDCKMS
jgi:hypothetical protein